MWACKLRRVRGYLPVGNEPMRDILRHSQKLVDDGKRLPEATGNGVQRYGTQPEPVECFAGATAMKWAEGMNVPTIEQNGEPEILWWVGCAPATDTRAQKDRASLCENFEYRWGKLRGARQEQSCTGDSARRAGAKTFSLGWLHKMLKY